MHWVAPSEKDSPSNTLYLVPNARFDFLLCLPQAKDIGAKVNEELETLNAEARELATMIAANVAQILQS